MGCAGNPEDRDRAPLAATAPERDEAIRWARELIAQGVKVVRLRSSAGQKPRSDEAAEPSRSTGD